MRSLSRGTGVASLELPGRPEVAAETPISLSGFAPELDGSWITTTVVHTLGSSGLTTSVTAEPPDSERKI
jgi:phage protein D